MVLVVLSPNVGCTISIVHPWLWGVTPVGETGSDSCLSIALLRDWEPDAGEFDGKSLWVCDEDSWSGREPLEEVGTP